MTDVFLDHQGRRARLGTGLIIFNSEQDVLVGQSYYKMPAVWHLPQAGSVEGLTPYANAMRVAKREVGLWGNQLWFVGFTPTETVYELHGDGPFASLRNYQAQMHRWAVFRYLNRDKLPPVSLSEDSHFNEDHRFVSLKWGAVDWTLENCEFFKYRPYVTALDEAVAML